MAYRQALWITQIKIGDRDIGRFKSWEGGGATSEDSKYDNWDGQIPLGGKKSRENGTAKRLYREEDHALAHWLDNVAIGQDATITRIPVGDDGVPWPGDSIVLKGILLNVKIPDHDQAQDDGGELELEFSLSPVMA